MGRLTRWTGILWLAGRRVWTRLTRLGPGQLAFSITGIALPVALVVLVTSVSLGMAATGTVRSPDIDYWIVPESGASSPVVSVQRPQIGQVHSVSRRVTSWPEITYATPVLVELIRLGTGDSREFLLAIGLIPGRNSIELVGISTGGMSAGDPYYANGSYSGLWTGDVVLSSGAASVTNLTTGGSFSVAANDSAAHRFTVVNVSQPDSGAPDFPVAIMRLSELQSITGSAVADSADQILVKTADPRVRNKLESVYPGTIVVEKGGLRAEPVLRSELALTLAILAGGMALVVGVLFTTTTFGLTIAATNRERAILSAIGFSGRTIALVVGVESVLIALAGGLIGVGIGWVAIPVANELASRFVVDTTIAQAHPILIPYGMAIALAIAILVLPYLLIKSNRLPVIEILSE